ncbi:hypothetical protein [Streptomyces sp. NPDC046925]|uniref:hypothetical protein n=1 Tax=Streptomyces sp. NPDC046925 TaxID=3155375 RepID=UPI0033C37287
MSEHHYVFVHPSSPHEQLVADLSWACGVQLRALDSNPDVDYSANLGYAAVELELKHEYEEDQGMLFERYNSVFAVRDFDSDIGRQEATARQIYERLASLRRYFLLLTLDVQEFLDAATPEQGVGQGRQAAP